MRKFAILAALLILGGCALKTGNVPQSEIDKLVADVQGTGAPVTINSGDTVGEMRTKINDAFAEHEAELAAIEASGGTDDQTASEVNVADAGGYYNGATVEAILQEIFPLLGSFDEDGTYTITGTFDYGDGTVVLPLLTLDPYDSGWENSQKIASQGDVYTKMEEKADAADLADQAAFEDAFFSLPSGGGSISISTDMPTQAGQAYLNDTTHVLSIASATGITQFTGSFTAMDTTPSAFSFTDVTDASTSTLYTSDAITVAGINSPAAISISGNGGEYEINTSGTWYTAAGTVEVDDTVKVRQTSSGSSSTQTDTTLTIGGVSDTYSVTTGAGGGECDGFLICQNFEGTGYDNSETWTSSNANADYTTTVLRGSQSLMLDLDNAVPYSKTSFTESGEVWVHLLFATSYNPGGVAVEILKIRDAADSETVYTLKYNGTSVYLQNGSASANGAYTIANDYTEYHFWLHLDAANKTGEVYVGTTTTRPGSPVASVTTGNATSTTVGIINITGPGYKTSTDMYIVDQVMVDDASFTTVSN